MVSPFYIIIMLNSILSNLYIIWCCIYWGCMVGLCLTGESQQSNIDPTTPGLRREGINKNIKIFNYLLRSVFLEIGSQTLRGSKEFPEFNFSDIRTSKYKKKCYHSLNSFSKNSKDILKPFIYIYINSFMSIYLHIR